MHWGLAEDWGEGRTCTAVLIRSAGEPIAANLGHAVTIVRDGRTVLREAWPAAPRAYVARPTCAEWCLVEVASQPAPAGLDDDDLIVLFTQAIGALEGQIVAADPLRYQTPVALAACAAAGLGPAWALWASDSWPGLEGAVRIVGGVITEVLTPYTLDQVRRGLATRMVANFAACGNAESAGLDDDAWDEDELDRAASPCGTYWIKRGQGIEQLDRSWFEVLDELLAQDRAATNEELLADHYLALREGDPSGLDGIDSFWVVV
jgi:hypothetical protein